MVQNDKEAVPQRAGCARVHASNIQFIRSFDEWTKQSALHFKTLISPEHINPLNGLRTRRDNEVGKTH